jgi:hypothetical protein
MTTTEIAPRQVEPAEDAHHEELAFLAAYDNSRKPPGWQPTPRPVLPFTTGSSGETLTLPTEVAKDPATNPATRPHQQLHTGSRR